MPPSSAVLKCLQAFKHVLVTSNFDDDSVKIKQASMEASLSHDGIISLWDIFQTLKGN